MTRNIPRIGFAFALGLVGACGSEEANEQVTPTCVSPLDPGCRIIVDEHSFVRSTGPITDGVSGGASIAVVRHAPGRFCMSGTVDSGADGSGWGAILTVGLIDRDLVAGMAIAPFDAAAVGIEKVRFSLDEPPLSGVLPRITQIQSAECKQVPECLMSFDRSSAITSPGTVTVPLTEFNRPDADHPNTSLDRTLITALQFYVASLPGMAFNFDFCVRNLAFLDAGGREVTP
ncbi:MAG TPA: hypothetical protein VFH68_16975 [Polyangia bacterium]|jgi:hypothetical protein|nr:hypothetical protein [Polyangia bacterium]